MLMYLIAGIALVGALAGLYGGVHHSGYKEGLAELQPKLTACQGQVSTMGVQIAGQNKAVDDLRAAGIKKEAEAAQALKQASAKVKVWQDNATRLQSILANRQPTGPKDCKAAWQEIRK